MYKTVQRMTRISVVLEVRYDISNMMWHRKGAWLRMLMSLIQYTYHGPRPVASCHTRPVTDAGLLSDGQRRVAGAQDAAWKRP